MRNPIAGKVAISGGFDVLNTIENQPDYPRSVSLRFERKGLVQLVSPNKN